MKNKLFTNNTYAHTYAVSKPHIENYRNALDIGARFAQYAEHLVKDFSHVYCFEPRVEYERDFESRLGPQGRQKTTLYNCALGDVNKKVTMYGAVIVNEDNCPKEALTNKTRIVEQRILDSYDFQNVDYMKIDVEGHELLVLKGATKTIERCRPLIVIEQNHITEQYKKGKKFDARDFLVTLGYEVVAYDEVADYILKYKN